MSSWLECELHGSLRHREPASGGDTWVCPGWDGEGCLNVRSGVPGDAAARLLSGQTWWPGVLVVADPARLEAGDLPSVTLS